MSERNTISIPVDVRNPGQFFACCGLMELAGRKWADALGWFEAPERLFNISAVGATTFPELVAELNKTTRSPELTTALKEERLALERDKKQHKKQRKSFPKGKEGRRKELGNILREGSIELGSPFELRLDWWKQDGADVPKTFAGSQEVFRIAEAALTGTVSAFQGPRPFDYRCVIRTVVYADPEESSPKPGKKAKRKAASDPDKAEPFYFDSRHGANALPLDIGFSPNELDMETKAYPAVELLCLIGLQRCRPMPTSMSAIYEYFLWDEQKRLGISLAPAAVCGVLGQRHGFRFENAYRTDQRKHKGYLPAIPFTR